MGKSADRACGHTVTTSYTYIVGIVNGGRIFTFPKRNGAYGTNSSTDSVLFAKLSVDLQQTHGIPPVDSGWCLLVHVRAISIQSIAQMEGKSNPLFLIPIAVQAVFVYPEQKFRRRPLRPRTFAVHL
jgi:hypothetical protein